MQTLSYIACPYSHPDANVRAQRYAAVNKLSASMMNSGKYVFSPISHCHQMAEDHGLPTTWIFWEDYDRMMISKCNELIVLMLPGWRESLGVQSEILIADELGIPVIYLSEDQL